MIEASNITCAYGSRIAVHDLSLRVSPGEMVAVIGPNGSGKTTLLRSLSRTLRPISGTVRLFGHDLSDLSPMESAQRVAVVPQFEEPAFAYTVRETIEMGRHPWCGGILGPEDAAQVERALDEFGLRALENRAFTQLSGGERQRVVLARALCQQTPAMLLDEPTAHMDVGYQTAALRKVASLAREGKCVVVALHDLNLATVFATRCALLFGGRLVAEGPVEDVLASGNLDEVYGTRFTRIREPMSGRLFVLPEVFQLEQRADRPRRVHVIGGGGSAAPLLSELWQLGHQVTLGVAYEGDSDFTAAQTFGITAVCAPSFAALDGETMERAYRLAQDADVVIVSESPYGAANLPNLDLAQRLREDGKTVYVVSRCREKWDFTDGAATQKISALLASGATEIPFGEITLALASEG